MAAFRRVCESCLVVEDIYPSLARRFQDAGVRRVAELGGGRGPIAFLADPCTALREARRALQPRGLFVASPPSRWNDPELEGLDPRWGAASSFDSEDSPW
jgi:hypothetical protein